MIDMPATIRSALPDASIPMSGPRSLRSSSVADVGPLTVISTGIGIAAVNVDLDTIGLPASLPLSSLAWLVIAGAWVLPTAQLVRPGRTGIDGATGWILALFALALVSAIWSVHPLRTLAAATVSAVTFLGAWAATSQLGWRTMIRVASVSLAAVMALGILRDAIAESLTTSWGSIIAGEQRFAGLTFSPTDLGRVASFAVVISLIAAAQSMGAERRTHLAGAAIGSFALVTSGTRLVAFTLICVGIVALNRPRTGSGFVVLVAVIAAVTAIALDPARLVESLGRPGESDAHVLQFAGRTPVWSAAIDMWSERPLLGFGWASNEVVFQEAFFRDAIGFNAFTAHNLGVGVLVDLGVVGLTVVGLGLVGAWASTKRAPDARLLLLLVVLTGTIEATLSRPSLVIAVLGMVTAAGALASRDREGAARA